MDKKASTDVPLPQGKKSIPMKLVFQLKTDESGNITRFKVSLVVQGFYQVASLDYDKSFAPLSCTLQVSRQH
jgi:hypothetical protein